MRIIRSLSTILRMPLGLSSGASLFEANVAWSRGTASALERIETDGRPLKGTAVRSKGVNGIAGGREDLTLKVSRRGQAMPPPTDLMPSTSFWQGLSGRVYRHSAHTTIYCPAPQRGVYVLAKRDGRGYPVPLFAGVAASAAATLNLAHIRRRAMRIGATEVHLCPVHTDGNVHALRRIVRDLRQSFATVTH